MGLKVSAREAARLANRTERTIRAWVASGKLQAEPAGSRERRQGVGPNRWLIDVDLLSQMPNVTLARVRLAELDLRAAEAGVSTTLVERVARLEREMHAVKAELAQLRRDRDTDIDGGPN